MTTLWGFLKANASHGTGSASCCRASRDLWEERNLQRVEVPIGQALGTSSDQRNWRALRPAIPRARAARSSPSHLQKHSDTSRPGKREKFPPCRAGISPLWEWGQRKKKNFWVQLLDPLLERAQLEGQADPFSPAFLQSWPLIYAADMQTMCCYSAFTYSACVCLLWTLHLFSVLQSQHRDDTLRTM